jgi:predicted dehydrogenase
MEVKRVVVVGCGSIGQRHARLLAARADVALELCEVQPENLERTLETVGQVPTYDSFERALESRPDVVLIATPIPAHAQQAIDALEAGAHVLCEKPMCDTVANARRMLKAVEHSDRVFSVGFVLHFHPAMRRIKELIDSGRLGRVMQVHWHIGAYLTLMNSVSRHQAELEGALMLDYAHQPDLLYWWLGQVPTAVYAAARQGGNLPLQSNPNIMAITLEYEGPLLATIDLNYVQHPSRSACEVIGDEGWVSFDWEAGRLIVGRRQEESLTPEDFSVERDSIYQEEQRVFLAAVAGERPPESPATEALVSMQIIEAAMASWKQQQRVLV